MRALGVRGLTEAQAKTVREGWKLETGAAFEQATLVAFQRKGAGAKLCEGKPVEANVAQQHAAHLVDVQLSCAGSFSSGNQ